MRDSGIRVERSRIRVAGVYQCVSVSARAGWAFILGLGAHAWRARVDTGPTSTPPTILN